MTTDSSVKLVGCQNFVRTNPRSDKFVVHKFDHLEFYCGDALNTYSRFLWGLGMRLVAKSNASTGNNQYSSYVLESGDVKFVFTSCLNTPLDPPCGAPHPGYNQDKARKFFIDHGFAVRAIGILVDDVEDAFNKSVENGGVAVLEPTRVKDATSGDEQYIAEVQWVDDVVLRFVSEAPTPFLPGYENVDSAPLTFGLKRVDHCVTNVPDLLKMINEKIKMTGFHEFGEFTAEDVGTVDSGLNSMILANNSEMVLLPINEPTFGTKRKSQIQTFLEQNNGAGVQHIAIKCDNIFETLTELRKRSALGGFDFMPRPSDHYYRNLPKKIGNTLTAEQYRKVEDLGLLVDQDEEGTLLQIFTKPLGDRMTLFIEIIQRIGCTEKDHSSGRHTTLKAIEPIQMGGCGGFGKGNFSELFKSIEDYEKLVEKQAAKAAGGAGGA